MHWYLDALRKYAVFSGRASRMEYWMFLLLHVCVYAVLVSVAVALENGAPVFLYYLGTLLPTLAVGVRRLHDSGRSGAWMLISLLPFGAIVLLALFAVESTPGANTYGPEPEPAPEGARTEAELYARSVARDLGPSHPQTLQARCGLARSYLREQQLPEALEELEATLQESTRSFGAADPGSRFVRAELLKACDIAESSDDVPSMEAALEVRDRVLGADAPETLVAMHGLAQCYRHWRRKQDAAEMLTLTLERCERVLGPQDEMTEEVRRDLRRIG